MDTQAPSYFGGQLAKWLRDYRTKRRLTQHQLAERLGWTQSVVGRAEGDAARQPTRRTISHIVDRLGGRATITISPRGVVLRLRGQR